ncbi:hypothetical protein JM79_2722 [Gramella sp. Hel_I_59]|uniref:hypothetical protein n=1 Tax=Gramella sp. Hel_I_59 TaxID=1249978 RepID=UPI0011537FB4|nr:hypothetical protein [Gramella sp. Hel_I_59]TQI71774.1 hypothetical protein JM79_2722 [Gramella sp. Hel_I_59]
MGLFDFLKKNSSKEKAVEKPSSTEPENNINQSFIDDGVKFEFPSGSRLELVEDKFEKTKILRFSTFAYYGLDKFMMFTDKSDSFLIGFRAEADKILLVISTYQKQIKLSKGDTVKVLFDDSEVLDFQLDKNGYKFDKDDGGVMVESYSEINEETLKRFVEHDIDKIRLQTKDGLNHNINFDLKTAEDFCEAVFTFHYSFKNFYQKEEYVSEDEHLKNSKS